MQSCQVSNQATRPKAKAAARKRLRFGQCRAKQWADRDTLSHRESGDATCPFVVDRALHSLWLGHCKTLQTRHRLKLQVRIRLSTCESLCPIATAFTVDCCCFNSGKLIEPAEHTNDSPWKQGIPVFMEVFIARVGVMSQLMGCDCSGHRPHRPRLARHVPRARRPSAGYSQPDVPAR